MILPRFGLCVASACVVLLLLAGCGGVPSPSASSTSATPTAAALAGNWLLAGSLPVFPTSGSSTSSGFGLTATFDVSGNQVTGIVTGQFPCVAFTSLGSGGVVTGTVAADGSFTLTSPLPASPGSTVTLTGKAPSSAGGEWNGTYSVTQPAGTCSNSFTGPIAATSLPLVSGTYSGAATFLSAAGAASSAVNLKLALQQGGTATNVLGNSLQSNTVLTGSIAVQGSSCYTSGTTTANPVPGAVEGNTVLGIFLMNDGSTLEMIGTTAAVDSSKLEVDFLTTTAGTCPPILTSATALSH